MINKKSVLTFALLPIILYTSGCSIAQQVMPTGESLSSPEQQNVSTSSGIQDDSNSDFEVNSERSSQEDFSSPLEPSKEDKVSSLGSAESAYARADAAESIANSNSNGNVEAVEPKEQIVSNNENSNTPETVVNSAEETADEAYARILSEYTGKLKNATPNLISEYKSEAKGNTEGISGLADLSIEKTSELAKISIDGTGKMAEILLNKDDGKYEKYESWAKKLTNVYMEEAAKISDVYLDSAM